MASGNFTVGQVADLVKEELERLTGQRVRLDIKDVQDFRNYKVSCDRATIELGFRPALGYLFPAPRPPTATLAAGGGRRARAS